MFTSIGRDGRPYHNKAYRNLKNKIEFLLTFSLQKKTLLRMDVAKKLRQKTGVLPVIPLKVII